MLEELLVLCCILKALRGAFRNSQSMILNVWGPVYFKINIKIKERREHGDFRIGKAEHN